MSLVTIEYKLVSVQYFLDEMQWYELRILMDNLNVSVKNDWTIAREIMWSNLKPWTKGKLKPDKIMTFPWEGKKKELQTGVQTENMLKHIKEQEEINRKRLMEIGVL